VESHDQALVGDKTVIFRLIDAEMYWRMSRLQESSFAVDRGIALHKMIRLITATTINGGYLNFMGNEFGHPEWIDFPREGNGWSYKYARRQWNLLDNNDLKYKYLGDFDREMIEIIRQTAHFQNTDIVQLWEKPDDQVLVYRRANLLFVFNFHPTNSYTDYGFLTEGGSYEMVLNTDNSAFGGFGNIDESVKYLTVPDELYKDKEWLKMYIPSRCGVVLRKMD
jgi:1,4-alpha-glucan branching enzyme